MASKPDEDRAMPSSGGSLQQPQAVLDANGDALQQGDVVTLTGAWLAKNANMIPGGFTKDDEFTACVVPVPLGHAVDLTPVSPALDRLMILHIPACTGTITVATTDVQKSPAAALPPYYRCGTQVSVGDVVRFTGVFQAVWGRLLGLTPGETFNVVRVSIRGTPLIEVECQDPAMQAKIASTLAAGVLKAKAADLVLVNVAPIPALPVQSLSSQATPSMWSVPDANGDLIGLGDTVMMASAALLGWASYLGILATEQFRIIGSVAINGAYEFEIEALDPQRQSRYASLLGGPLLCDPVELIKVAPHVPVASHYAPVVATNEGQKVIEKKPFDHSSLGTDLSGDELMKSIRDFCEGNGHV